MPGLLQKNKVDSWFVLAAIAFLAIFITSIFQRSCKVFVGFSFNTGQNCGRAFADEIISGKKLLDF